MQRGTDIRSLLHPQSVLLYDGGSLYEKTSGLLFGVGSGNRVGRMVRDGHRIPNPESQSEANDRNCAVFHSGDGQRKEDASLCQAAAEEAEGKASLVELKAGVDIGNSYVYAQGSGAVGIGVVKGEVKTVISKEEITVKANVGAAAIQGEVKGKISIFGCTITLTGIGEVGSIGAGVEFSSKTGEIEFGGKASFLAGLGFKVNIDYG